MKPVLACVFVVACAATTTAQTALSLSDLRSRLKGAVGDELNVEQVRELSGAAFALAKEAPSRGSFWNTMSFVAELCEAAPHLEARQVRARALEMLSERFSDAMRWSSLVSGRFIPNFEAIRMSDWQREIEEYDRLLDRLRAKTDNDQVAAELLYAKARVRVHIDRRWDWLTPQARRQTIGLLDTLVARYGGLPCPGEDGEQGEYFRDLARQHFYELEKLYFGAPAPITFGTDLLGQRIDISDYQGKIVVLDFWTTFCQPCLAMVPKVLALLEKLDGRPVVYIGVNGDSDRRQALRTAKRLKMTWRNLWDGPKGPDGPASTTWNVAARGWPAVFVIDSQGRIRYKLAGSDQVDESLERAIMTLLAEIAD